MKKLYLLIIIIAMVLIFFAIFFGFYYQKDCGNNELSEYFTSYVKNKCGVFFNNINIGADTETFQYIKDGYGKDKNFVYYWGGKIINADSQSFQVFNRTYAKDKKNVYFEKYIIVEADSETFKFINNNYAQDKNNIYCIKGRYFILGKTRQELFELSKEKRQLCEGLDNDGSEMMFWKPVIYLYPQKIQRIAVNLDYDGKIIADYPEYDDLIKGWDVIAYPDGKIINIADNKEYNYLFWEGEPNKIPNYDLSSGFVVAGKDIKEFLQNTLSKIGLEPKEYNEFIVYWYPKMKDNKYNLIYFAGKEYEDTAKLKVFPQPNSILRVFMVFKALNEKIEVKPQEIKPFIRKGFTVVEWGGTELK
jgi:hypothetical protein